MELARHQDPIAAIATAPGKGAVGVVRISGKDVFPLIDQICRRQLRAREATYLPFVDANGQAIDHGLAIHFPAPNSYTGEDVLELQAHGGPIVLQLLLARCLEISQTLTQGHAHHPLSNMRLAQPGEFTQRAFLNDKLDLAQAEAIADLIDASTEQAARSASRSLAGVFSQHVNDLRDGLVHLRTLVEATLDFPEEEIDFIESYGVRQLLEKLTHQLKSLQSQTQQGALLREGMQVVIAGQPNVGKSSLLNALAGEELAIVTPIAGTTRDIVRQSIQIEGVPLHVVDTAGLRGEHEGSADAVETIGMARAWSQIERADAVLFLHDLSRLQDADHQAQDLHIARELLERIPAKTPIIHVWNKADAAHQAPGAPADGSMSLQVSAKTGQGLDTLRQALLQVIGWTHQTEGLFIARARHVQALQHVEQHLQQAAMHVAPEEAHMLDLMAEELRLAQSALGEITGEFSADDLLGSIFSNFCIGK